MSKKEKSKTEVDELRENYIKIGMSIAYGLMIVSPIIIWFLFHFFWSDISSKESFINAIITAFIINGFIGLISMWVLTKERGKALDVSIKRVRADLLKEHFSVEEVQDSLKRGFEYCENNVGTFRVYALNTNLIVEGVEEKKDSIHIDNCQIMVSEYENISTNRDEVDDDLEKNIGRWEDLKCIEHFDYTRYDDCPLDYYCIFDNKFISFGQYYFKETKTDLLEIKHLKSFSITNQTEAGQKIIENYIKQFDSYFNLEKRKFINFDNFADRYDEYRTADDEIIQILKRESNIEKKSKILDFGCGTGNYIDKFQKSGFGSILGLDISKKMRKKAKEKTHTTIHRNFNGVNETFDFIFIIDVIHLITDINLLAKKLHMRCNNGAKIAIVTKSQEQIRNRNYINKFFPKITEKDLKRYHDIDMLIEAFQDVGFECQKNEEYKENTDRKIDLNFLNNVRNKCFSMFELIHEDDFNQGIRNLEEALRKAGGTIMEKYTGKTILFFSKKGQNNRRNLPATTRHSLPKKRTGQNTKRSRKAF